MATVPDCPCKCICHDKRRHLKHMAPCCEHIGRYWRNGTWLPVPMIDPLGPKPAALVEAFDRELAEHDRRELAAARRAAINTGRFHRRPRQDRRTSS